MYSDSTDINVHGIWKSHPSDARLTFDQTSGHHNLAKLTQKISHPSGPLSTSCCKCVFCADLMASVMGAILSSKVCSSALSSHPPPNQSGRPAVLAIFYKSLTEPRWSKSRATTTHSQRTSSINHLTKNLCTGLSSNKYYEQSYTAIQVGSHKAKLIKVQRRYRNNEIIIFFCSFVPKSCVFPYLLHFIFAVNNCMPMYSKSFARIITPDCQHSE